MAVTDFEPQRTGQSGAPNPNAGGGGIPLQDGTQAAPALAFIADPTLGLYRKNASTMGWAVSNENIYDAGNDTIVNVDPVSPATVRYAFRGYQLALNGVSETAFFYARIDPIPANRQMAAMYVDITGAQLDTDGPAIKVIHAGHGDGIYVAQFANGSAYEAATWADGSRGYISTLQIGGLPNSTLFNALWDQPEVPNFGMYYADGCVGNALTIQKRAAGAADGVTEIRLLDNGGRQRFGLYNDGSLQQNSVAATAGSTLKESPELRIQGAYWDGAVTRDIGYTVKTVVTAANVAEMRLFEVAPAGSTLLMIVRRSGAVGQVDMQNGSMVNVASIQSSANRDDYSGGRLTLQLNPTAVDEDTGILVLVRQGGADVLKRVLQGPADSAGVGFRYLRVAN